jgi:hypothetical protein
VAGATAPCGKALLADWFDNGRIDRIYRLACYEDAIDAIPPEIRDYSDAEDVISRAFQAATSGRLPRDRKDSGDQTLLRRDAVGPVDTSAPSSVPLPLLVLGGMSLALLATGGLGYVSRRRRAQTDEPNDDAFDL